MSKKLISAFLLYIFVTFGLSAQKEIISTASKMLNNGNSKAAASYLDSILKVNPQCVDALMMKGNVILNENHEPVELKAIYDESIYDATIGAMQEADKKISDEAANKIGKLWKECIAIDPKRLDLYYGICAIYAMALMKEEVIKNLPALIKAADSTSDSFIYSLEDYALPFMKADRFDDCLDVYKAISRAFPESGGLLCDIAVLCQKNGRIKESVQYTHQALTKKNNDYLTSYSAVSIIALGEDPQAAEKVFMPIYDNNEIAIYAYYRALFKFYDNDKSWNQTLQHFRTQYKRQRKDDPRPEIASLMLSKDFQPDSVNFEIVGKMEPYELDLLLIALRVKSQMPGFKSPLFKLANLYASKNCFPQAIAILKEMKPSTLNAEEDSTYHFLLAYAQYEDSLKTQSIENWKPLLNSSKFFRQSAACYFIGSAYLQQGKKEEAKELFTRVAARASESKFANYCRWKLSELENKKGK